MPKKKKPIKNQHFQLHPYPSCIHVIVGDTIEDTFAKVRKITNGEFCNIPAKGVAHCSAGLDPDGKHHVFMCFKRDADKHPGTVAHECVHAIDAIYEYVGAGWDIINDEPQAYLMGQLVTDVTTCIKNAK